MKILIITLLFLTLAGLDLAVPLCGQCPTSCDFGTVIHVNKQAGLCFCECSLDPCQRKTCPQFRACKVVDNPNCFIGYCMVPKIAVCVSMPAPLILIEQSAFTLDFGSNYNIQPYVEYYGHPQFKWFKDNQEMLPPNAVTFGSILSFNNINKFDQGVYTLVVSDEYGSNSVDVEVVVSDPVVVTQVQPKEIFSLYVKQDSIIEIQEDLNYDIYCKNNIEDSNSYWHRSERLHEEFSQEPSELLKIRNAKLTYSGEYSCRLIEQDQTKIIRVIIQVKDLCPIVARISYEKQALINDNLSIYCGLSLVENSPIEWSFNGHDPSDLDNVKINNYEFRINKVDYNLNGKLSCFKKLMHDRFIEESALIKVINPYPEIKATKSRVSIKEGQTAYLACKTSCMDNCKIYWYDPFGILIDSNDHELTLNNVQLINSGKYTCEAKNQYGNSKDYIQLDVYEVTMKVEVSPNNLNLNPYDDAFIECIIQTNDETDIKSIKWIRKNYNKLPETFTTGNRILIITSIRKEDSGDYECVVTSRQGKEYHGSLKINVLNNDQVNPFQVYLNLKSVHDVPIGLNDQIRLGNQFNVECSSDIEDVIDITWAKESGIDRTKVNKLSNQIAILEIPSFMSIDLGKYFCIITDSSGKRAQNSIEFKLNGNKGNLISFKIDGPSKVEQTTTTESTTSSTTPTISTSQIEEKTESEIYESNQNVKLPSAIIVNPKMIALNSNDWIKIECVVSHSDNVTFEKYNGSLPKDSYVYHNESVFLVLSNLKPKDTGFYLCYAANKNGIARDHTYIQVLEDESSFKESGSGGEGGSGGNDSNTDQDNDENETTASSITSRITQNNEEKIATFEPEAKIHSPKELVLNEGDPLELICQVKNSNKTEFKHIGHVNASFTINQNDDLFTLVVDHVTKDHSGYYTCTVYSDYGVYRDHVYLDVVSNKETTWNDVPMVEIDGPDNIVVKEGDSVEIKCKVDGSDKIVMSKQFDSKILEYEKSGNYYSVWLKDLKIKDMDYYVCTGVNDYGEKSDYVYVEVLPLENREEIKDEIVENEEVAEEPSMIQSTRIVSTKQPVKFWLNNSNNFSDIPRVEILGEKKISVKKGDSIEIVCEVRDGNQIEFKSYQGNWPGDYESEHIGNLYKMRFKNLEESDSDYYLCLSANQHGQSVDYIQLQVVTPEQDNIDY
ncbi:unnamed protein product [Brachionus calyciflorus]|uniref:Ig-like domain-containing protein n=1 Tax=Brachionus calyciflorus TaxID=104777 RepID=A0A813W860_9BILA|nr:unnamed protein product [Brachionus calyciflorus]